MADAIVATWHGGNYQARVFWQNALCILMDYSPISEVSFEADGPKAFDDVVVKYDPPIARSGSERVSADYHQIKWHVDTGGRFGYEDLTKPEFIGAASRSVKMPARRVFGVPSVVIKTQPRRSRCMARMASVTLSDGEKSSGVRVGRPFSGSWSSSESKTRGRPGDSSSK